MGEDVSRATLVRPPPVDNTKSAIENVLELTALGAIGPDIFTNTRPLWHPPGARGVYGGAVIAQCLAAAQQTVPSNFTVHSMHCYFVLAGDSTIPILYHVEHVREGRSFATRTVQARQRGRCIFTTTMSFARENSGGQVTIQHAAPLPDGMQPPAPAANGDDAEKDASEDSRSPFESRQIGILNEASSSPVDKRTRHWIRARGTISAAGGHQAHLSALAYMSDSYFIGTVSRIHDLERTNHPPGLPRSAAPGAAAGSTNDGERLRNKKDFQGVEYSRDAVPTRPEIGMMVSLDHTIYFHEPRRFRADEWMFTEMESPWAGDGRGVVQQKVFAADGTLVATCFQEGVVRLKQEAEAKKANL